jgi:hypothetical protein
VLIGAGENAEEKLGIAFKPDIENERKADTLRDPTLPREVVREPRGRWK